MRARRDLFPADLGLVLRMVAVGLLTPLVVLAALALCDGCVADVAGRSSVVIVRRSCIGVWVGDPRARRRLLARAPALTRPTRPSCTRSSSGCASSPTCRSRRSCSTARTLPNSWIEGTKRGGFRLHLTQGLLDLLEPRELEAVIAHELAHVANRDAAVMTVVGGPGEALLSGGVRVAGQGWWPIDARRRDRRR